MHCSLKQPAYALLSFVILYNSVFQSLFQYFPPHLPEPL